LDRNDRALKLSLEKRQNQLESGSNKKDINDNKTNELWDD